MCNTYLIYIIDFIFSLNGWEQYLHNKAVESLSIPQPQNLSSLVARLGMYLSRLDDTGFVNLYPR